MKTNPKSLLKYFLYLNIIFLLIYILFLKNHLLEKIKLTQEEPNYIFYFGIFNNLEIAITCFLIFLIAVLLFWNKIKKLIISITDFNKLFLCLLIAVIFLKILLLVFVQTIPFSDAELYLNLAKRLYETGSYLNNSGDYSVYFPVGYPFILSIFLRVYSDAVLVGKIFNIIIFSGTLIILYSLFKSKLNKNQLVIFLLTFAFLPNNFFSSNVLMTDYLFLFMVWLILFIVLREKIRFFHLIIIGILIGLTAYIRPLALAFPLLFLLYFIKLDKKSAILKFGIIAIFMFLTILPWTLRNYNLFDSIILVSANTGTNFLIGNHPNANGGYNFDTASFPSAKTEVAEDKMAFRKGLDDIWNNPVKSILRIPVKIFRAYYRFDSSFIWTFKKTDNQIPDIILSIFFYFSNVLFFLILFFNLFYVLKNGIKINLKFNYLLALFYGYTLLLIIVFFGSDRFIIPVIPIHIFLFAKYFFNGKENYEFA